MLITPLFPQKHNLCCDNCHSHVAMALNLMRYENSTSWNMVKLCLLSLIHGKHVRWGGAQPSDGISRRRVIDGLLPWRLGDDVSFVSLTPAVQGFWRPGCLSWCCWASSSPRPSPSTCGDTAGAPGGRTQQRPRWRRWRNGLFFQPLGGERARRHIWWGLISGLRRWSPSGKCTRVIIFF